MLILSEKNPWNKFILKKLNEILKLTFVKNIYGNKSALYNYFVKSSLVRGGPTTAATDCLSQAILKASIWPITLQ